MKFFPPLFYVQRSNLQCQRPADDQHEGALQAAPEYANMTPEEFEALLQEMEPDIRAADRDMREIEFLERKGVTGAGRLAGAFMNTLFLAVRFSPPLFLNRS